MAMATDQFAEEDDSELRAALMNEFNTLCTIYRVLPENFIEDENIVKFVKGPPEHPLPKEAGVAPVVDPGVNHLADHFGGAAITDVPAPATAAPAPVSSGEVDLLGFGDDFGAPPPLPAANTNSLQTLSLKSSVSLTGDEYQSKWGAVPDAETVVVSALPLRLAPSSTDVVESSLSAFNVFTMASGELPTEFKFFLYCQEEAGGYYLIQAVVQKAPASLTLTIKPHGGDNDRNKIDQVVELMKTSLGE
jgi:hypothetical protein